MLTLEHNGRTLTGTAERIARDVLSANGEPQPHPALLADTVREVEYFAVEVETSDVWEVVKDSYEVPCEHIACDQVHRHLYNASLAERTLIEVYNLHGEYVGSRWETRYHEVTRTFWVILRNGERVGSAHATKRAALAEAATKPTI